MPLTRQLAGDYTSSKKCLSPKQLAGDYTSSKKCLSPRQLAGYTSSKKCLSPDSLLVIILYCVAVVRPKVLSRDFVIRVEPEFCNSC